VAGLKQAAVPTTILEILDIRNPGYFQLCRGGPNPKLEAALQDLD
jgi:hypothetical protein